jgi:sugar/nucleoside kinase (ribokinase family)
MFIAVGNPVYDLIKTQKVEPEGRILSGCSINVALALAKLGAEVFFVGCAGDDYKQQLEKKLNKFNIAHQILPSKETGGFSLHYYDDFGNRTLKLISRAGEIDPLSPSLYESSEAVLIGPILGEVSFDQIKRIRQNYNGIMFCDPQGMIRGADEQNEIFHTKVDGIEEILGLFDIVKPNELEGRILSGIDCREDPYKAAEIIKSWGPKIVIVTLAELGSVVYDGNEFYDIPPYDAKVVDATGCGDTHMAGFIFEYFKTDGDLRRSGCFAAATSSIMLEHVGPEFPMTEARVRTRQEQLLAMTDYKVKVKVNAA